MATVVFEGKQFALAREKVLKSKIAKFGFRPRLASLFFKEDPTSILYTNLKEKVAGRIGIDFHGEEVSLSEPLESLARKVRRFSQKKDIQAVMVQKPAKKLVVETIDVSSIGFEGWWKRLATEIEPGKDVDCLHPANLDLIYLGCWRILPATVRAVLSILDYTGTVPLIKPIDNLSDRTNGGTVPVVAVVGKSEIVGKPLAHVLAQKGCKVWLCGSEGVVSESLGDTLVALQKPQDLISVTQKADILVSAVGKPGIISGEMVKSGVVVVDVGAPLGDVDFEAVARKASFVTPVPGGVGPTTVISLMENLIDLL